jgi:hypothetical protein
VLALDAEVDVVPAGVGHEADHGFRAVDVEVVHDQVPRCVGTALCQHVGQPLREVLLGAGRADVVADFAGDHIEGGDQGQGAVADVLELAPFDQAGAHGQARRAALDRLHAGHLVDTACLDAGGGAFRRQPL